MSKKQYVVELVEHAIRGGTKGNEKITAQIIVERLIDEGLLVLGYGDADIDRVVETFKETFGTSKVSKYDRFAAGRLCKVNSVNAVCGIIKLLGQRSQEKYAPVVNSISQLEEKWPSVVNFLRGNNKPNQTIQV